MTQFSFEVPLRHLDDFTDLQDYFFALSFLCEDPRYVDYLKRERVHRIITLDNSFNELGKAQTAQEMRKYADLIKADYVVSPDSDSWTPIDMMNTYKAMKGVGFSTDVIILPIRSIEEYSAARIGGVKSMAIPYEFRPLFPEEFPWNRMHFLGMRDPLEVKMCRPLSCDTSMPIKIALRGQTIREWILKCCPHEDSRPNFFQTEMTIAQVELARRNIKELKEMCA